MLKVENIAHCRQDRSGLNRPNSGDGGEDLPLAGRFDALGNLDISLLDVFLEHAQFANELALLQDQTTLAADLFDANTLAGQVLQLL